MYRAGPAGTTDAGAAPLGLAGARRQAFTGASPAARDPEFHAYLTDLARPYGTALRQDLLAGGAGQSYGEMAGPLVTALVPASRPADLIVLAYAVNDVVPGRATAAHLSYLCPGRPAAFAVCDQGSAAPFTALRLIAEYGRTGGCRRAVLVVVEQATLHYEPAGPAPLPQRDAAVALLWDEDGSGRPGPVAVHPGVTREQAGARLRDELGRLAEGRDDPTLILGPGLAGIAGPEVFAGPVIAAPGALPLTGTWWELAGGLDRWRAAGQRVVLADYEPSLEYLSLVPVDLTPAPAPVP